MKNMSWLVLAWLGLLQLLHTIQAASVDVIQKPNGGVTATAGQTTAIVWIPVGDEMQGEGSLTITLVQGNGTSLKTVVQIANGIADSQGSYSWTVPTNILTGNDYSVALFNSITGTVFSNYFVIEGVNAATSYSYSQGPALITPPSTSVTAAAYMTPTGVYSAQTTSGTLASLLSSASAGRSSASTESNSIAASTDTAPPSIGQSGATRTTWSESSHILGTLVILTLCMMYGWSQM